MPAWFQTCVLPTWVRMPAFLKTLFKRTIPNPGWLQECHEMLCPLSVTRLATRHVDPVQTTRATSPCSPPSFWRMLWTSPESLSHRKPDLRPWINLANGTTSALTHERCAMHSQLMATLERAGCPLHCRAWNNIPNDNAPDSNVWFCQRCQSSQSNQIHDAVRDLDANNLLGHQEEKSGVVQERARAPWSFQRGLRHPLMNATSLGQDRLPPTPA